MWPAQAGLFLWEGIEWAMQEKIVLETIRMGSVLLRSEKIYCGKEKCRWCPHPNVGSYWFAYWTDGPIQLTCYVGMKRDWAVRFVGDVIPMLRARTNSKRILFDWHPDSWSMEGAKWDDEEEIAPNKEKKETKDLSGDIYLLKMGDFYKIGSATCAKRRTKQFMGGPYKTELLHVLPVEDRMAAEREWQRRFANKRVKGEWFDLTDEDVELFCSSK